MQNSIMRFFSSSATIRTGNEEETKICSKSVRSGSCKYLKSDNDFRPSEEPENWTLATLEFPQSCKNTALFVQINGFQQLQAQEIADAVAELHGLVEQHVKSVGTALVVEKRWDSFVLFSYDLRISADLEIANTEKRNANAGSCNSVDRMLTLAVDLHTRLLASKALKSGELQLAMGIASGTMALLGFSQESSWAARSALGGWGDSAAMAETMAGIGADGAVAVHESALWRWAAATRRLPPASAMFRLECGELRRAAMFDVRERRFLPQSAVRSASWTTPDGL
jgi:hypothetical protein